MICSHCKKGILIRGLCKRCGLKTYSKENTFYKISVPVENVVDTEKTDSNIKKTCRHCKHIGLHMKFEIPASADEGIAIRFICPSCGANYKQR